MAGAPLNRRRCLGSTVLTARVGETARGRPSEDSEVTALYTECAAIHARGRHTRVHTRTA